MIHAYDAPHKMPWWRLKTAKYRGLPSFMVIGVEKGGTSSLAEYLTNHKRIAVPYAKEARYFLMHYGKGIKYYQCNFPFKFLMEKRNQITFDASPVYLYFPQVPKNILDSGMKFKYIVMLRDPVDRAYSHFQMLKRIGIKKAPNSFPELVEDELSNPVDPNDFERAEYACISRGYYAEQLERWFKYFGRENFLILKNQELKHDKRKTVEKVVEFVGLDPKELNKIPDEKHNKGEYEPIGEQEKKLLKQHYKPYNQKLEELLGMEFNWD